MLPKIQGLAALLLLAGAGVGCASPVASEATGASEQHVEEGNACVPTEPVSYSGISDEEAEYREEYHRERGASVTKQRNEDSTFDLVATYPPNQRIITHLDRPVARELCIEADNEGGRGYLIEQEGSRFEVYLYSPCEE